MIIFLQPFSDQRLLSGDFRIGRCIGGKEPKLVDLIGLYWANPLVVSASLLSIAKEAE